MPEPTFRGDPYRVLGVDRDATLAEIRRRRRELAREHHPDIVGGDTAEAEARTTRMARINAAYDLLRDPVRRAKYEASPQARRAREAEGRGAAGSGADYGGPGSEPLAGPPPPPRTRPVTARYDTSAAYRPRNATTTAGGPILRGHPPIDRRRGNGSELRASTPTGPVRRRATRPAARIPSLDEALATLLEFGRFHGYTLGDVAELEPTYIDWIARTITRDRDLVVRARVIQADLDERGVERAVRPPRPGFGNPREAAEERASSEATL